MTVSLATVAFLARFSTLVFCPDRSSGPSYEDVYMELHTSASQARGLDNRGVQRGVTDLVSINRCRAGVGKEGGRNGRLTSDDLGCKRVFWDIRGVGGEAEGCGVEVV